MTTTDRSIETTTDPATETADAFPEGLRVLQVAMSDRSFFRQQVAALEERGVSCTTVTVPRPGSDDRGPREFARFYAEAVRRAFDGQDVVHANYGLVGPLALALPVRPVVLTLWGSELMGDIGWLERASRFAAGRSDAVVVPSRVLSRELDRPHRVIPFGVDTDLFRPIDRRRARERVGWDPGGRHVLFPYDPGREVKNYPLAESVVEAAAADATLHTVSGVSYEEMPYYMNASDALLVTSARESGPMVVREAAACDVPVVSTDVGFVAETLGGVDGSYVAATESELVGGLDAVFEGDGRSDARGAVDGIGLDRMADRLVETYRSVIDP